MRWTYTGLAGSSNSQGLAIDNFSLTTNPNSLPPCAELSVQPTNMLLSATATSVSGTFQLIPSPTTVQNYLILKSTAATLTQLPVDGTHYTSSQTVNGGNGIVVGVSVDENFTDNNIIASTTYYYFVFATNNACTGAPFYSASSLDGTTTTTNATTGIPAGYYDAANGLSGQPLKTAVKNIIINCYQTLSYTPGLWNLYQFSDLHRNDANTADIIWDMYSDNPTGPEPYSYTYGTNQCGSGGSNVEGDCYNREHSTPQSWFLSASPMVTDAHHVFPTDKVVNANRSNFPYGEVTNASITSLNGSKLGTGTNFGYSGTIFEPIDAYKGDFARACLYMATRYEDEIMSQNWSLNGSANQLFLSLTDEPDVAKRRLQIYDAWQLNTLVK